MNKLVLPTTQPKKTISLAELRNRKKTAAKDVTPKSTTIIATPEPIVTPVEIVPEPQKAAIVAPAFVENFTAGELIFICAFNKRQALNGIFTRIKDRDAAAIARKQAILTQMDALLLEIDTLIALCGFETIQGMSPVRFGKDGLQQSDLVKLRALRILSAGKVKQPVQIKTAKQPVTPSKPAKK